MDGPNIFKMILYCFANLFATDYYASDSECKDSVRDEYLGWWKQKNAYENIGLSVQRLSGLSYSFYLQLYYLSFYWSQKMKNKL